MRKMTEENLKNAFAGESQAHMRYLIFAKKAEDEGFPNVARVFRAIAYAELVHATNHYNALGMIRSTSDNLQVAIDGELYEVNEMYPAYNIVAKIQEERNAERTTNWALQAEKVHASIYQRAKQAVDEGKDLKIGSIYICNVCGYTVEDEAPSRCPICGAPKERFKIF
ncbi:MAG: rubrerythrin family protein [Candidatus Methanomethyliaceae archaeon]|nr:rubrerythrin family protein [Candidatus Methanomethyliaceae archaeon]MDW7970313.1 rubrerythrin family protein [Nitrososphaerota archaeon]